MPRRALGFLDLPFIFVLRNGNKGFEEGEGEQEARRRVQEEICFERSDLFELSDDRKNELESLALYRMNSRLKQISKTLKLSVCTFT